MTVWFTGDTHFHHKWMAKWRGYQSVEDMHAGIIERWNDLVAKNDDVWHLGDFAFGRQADARIIFNELHGKKHLIRGNHDPKWAGRLPWAAVHDVREFRHDGHRIWLSHYPHLTWPKAHHGTWHLHGHSHGNLGAETTTRMDVGMDATGDVLIPLDTIIDVMTSRQYVTVDHHDPDTATE